MKLTKMKEFLRAFFLYFLNKKNKQTEATEAIQTTTRRFNIIEQYKVKGAFKKQFFLLYLHCSFSVGSLPGFWEVKVAPPPPPPPLPRTDCYYSLEFFPDLPVSWELNPTLSLTRPPPG